MEQDLTSSQYLLVSPKGVSLDRLYLLCIQAILWRSCSPGLFICTLTTPPYTVAGRSIPKRVVYLVRGEQAYTTPKEIRMYVNL